LQGLECCNFPHAWGGTLDLSWAKYEPTSYLTFAWNRVQRLVLGQSATDTWLSHITCLPLRRLDLHSKNITDAGLEHLKSLPLQHFELFFSHVTAAGLANLSSMPLRYLDLSYCIGVSDAGIANFSSMSLEKLRLTFTGVLSIYFHIHVKVSGFKMVRCDRCNVGATCITTIRILGLVCYGCDGRRSQVSQNNAIEAS